MKMLKTISFFIKLFILIITIVVMKSSSTVRYVSVENDNINKTINLATVAMKVEEVQEETKYEVIDTLTGDLTGYAFDCPLCNGTLGCLPTYYIKDGKTTYFDYEYGTVMIVATSKQTPCGSIIRFNSKRVSDKPVFAIVLDRGVRGNAVDLLTPSEKYAADYIGRSQITYDILRKGWE